MFCRYGDRDEPCAVRTERQLRLYVETARVVARGAPAIPPVQPIRQRLPTRLRRTFHSQRTTPLFATFLAKLY